MPDRGARAAVGARPARPVRRRRAARCPTGVRVGLGVGADRRRARGGRSGRSSAPAVPHRRRHDLAVQITLGIMAAKLLACGVVVIKYPELKARWHRPPGQSRPADGPSGEPGLIFSAQHYITRIMGVQL